MEKSVLERAKAARDMLEERFEDDKYDVTKKDKARARIMRKDERGFEMTAIKKLHGYLKEVKLLGRVESVDNVVAVRAFDLSKL